MHLEAVGVSTLVVPFREAFVSGALRWDRRRISLLSLRTDSGVTGWAEFVAPEPGDLGADPSTLISDVLTGIDLADPVRLERGIRRLDASAFVGRAARAAAESALVDLLARLAGRSVAAALTSQPSSAVGVNALLAMMAPGEAAAAAHEAVSRGFRCLKLKGGDEPVGALCERLVAVRDASGPDVALRVDFNGKLATRSAAAIIEQLAPFDLEYVEQPIPPSAGVAALARLRRDVSVPIAADEAVRDLGTARELLDAGAVDAIVLKPARVGGLRQASSIAELATAQGVPVTVSTLFETGVGIAGSLHLAASVPGSQAHGLATAELLESDLLVTPLSIIDGSMALPIGLGLAIELDPAAIARYRAS